MRDIDQLLIAARRQGWAVQKRGSGHFMLTPAARGSPLIVVSGTPSDHRAFVKARCQLIKAGLVLPDAHPGKETTHMAKRTTATTSPRPTTTTSPRPTTTTSTAPAKPSRSARANAASSKAAITRVPRRPASGSPVDDADMALTPAQAAQVARETRAVADGPTLAPDAKLDRDLAHLGDPQAGRRVAPSRRRDPDEEPLVYRGKRQGMFHDQHIDILVPDEDNDERIFLLQETISGLDEDSQREAWARAAALRNRAPEPYVPLTDRLTVSGIHYHFELDKITLVHEDDVAYVLQYPAYRIERVGDDRDESGLPAAIIRRNAKALANQARRAS